MKKVIKTNKACIPSKTVSQATIHNNTVYVCGQISYDVDKKEIIHGTVKEQTYNALLNLKAILEEAGSSLDNVLSTNVYISSMDVFNEMDEVYGEFFTKNPPARVTVAVKELFENLDVEISCVAFIE